MPDRIRKTHRHPVRKRAGGRADAQGRFEPSNTGGMAEPRAEIDVVGAKHSGEFLKNVIYLIGEAARCREESHPV